MGSDDETERREGARWKPLRHQDCTGDLLDRIDGLSPEGAVDIIFECFMDLMERRDTDMIERLFFELRNHTREAHVEVLLAPLAITSTWTRNPVGRRAYFNDVAGELVRRDRRDIFELLHGLYRVRVPSMPLSRKARAERRAPHPILLLGGDPEAEPEGEESVSDDEPGREPNP